MKLGLKTIVLALVVALLCVPAAFAKGPGGHGHGKPSWAGQGKSHEKKAKLDKAHAKKAKHEKKQKHQKVQAHAEADQELNLEDLNPAWQCFMVESMMDTQDAEAVADGAEPGEFSSFDAEFGTNENKRNSHGMCVSAAAHGDDVAAGLAAEEEQSCEEPAADEGTDDSTVEDGTEDSTVEDGADNSIVEDDTDDSTVEDGTEEPVADDPADDGSEEPAGDAEECESDDSAGADDQVEDDQVEGDQGEETEVAAFARALVRFIKL
jgi:hypothetical protein